MNKLVKVGKKLGMELSAHSPQILMWLGISGVATTTILGIKATPKALIAIQDKEQENVKKRDKFDKDLTNFEKFKIVWPYYVPTAMSGLMTVTCIVGSNKILSKRNVVLASLYAVAEKGMETYQAKVVELLGEKKEQKLRDEISQDSLNENPVEQRPIILTGKGETLIFDALSGRYFKSDMESIRKIVNDFNAELLDEMYKPLNDLYYMLDLEGTEIGQHVGWLVEEGLLHVEYTAKIATNREPCIVMNFTPKPNKYVW